MDPQVGCACEALRFGRFGVFRRLRGEGEVKNPSRVALLSPFVLDNSRWMELARGVKLWIINFVNSIEECV